MPDTHAIRVELIGPGSQQRWMLDAPDSTFIGPWIKAIFDQMNSGRPVIPTTFTIKIS